MDISVEININNLWVLVPHFHSWDLDITVHSWDLNGFIRFLVFKVRRVAWHHSWGFTIPDQVSMPVGEYQVLGLISS